MLFIFFFYISCDHRCLHSFPTRRSSDLSASSNAAPASGGFSFRSSSPSAASSDSEGDRNEKRSEEHTSELQSPVQLVCRLLLEKKKLCVTREYYYITKSL